MINFGSLNIFQSILVLKKGHTFRLCKGGPDIFHSNQNNHTEISPIFNKNKYDLKEFLNKNSAAFLLEEGPVNLNKHVATFQLSMHTMKVYSLKVDVSRCLVTHKTSQMKTIRDKMTLPLTDW